MNKQKYNFFKKFQALFFAVFLLILNFSSASLSLADTSQYKCSANIVFDVNPKSGVTNVEYAISGSVTISGLVRAMPTISNSDVGYCGSPNNGNPMKSFSVAVYDQTSKQPLLSNINFNMPGLSNGNGSQVYSLPAYKFKPSNSFNTTSGQTLNLAVAAKVILSDGYQLTESAPVNLSLKGATTQPAAAATDPATPGSPAATPAPNTTNCSGPNADANSCLYNPLPVDNLTATLLLITKGFLGIIAVWSVAFIIIGGFRLVMSQGNEEQVTVAKKTITYAILGLAVAILAFSIVAILQYVLRVKIQDVTTKTSMQIKAVIFKA